MKKLIISFIIILILVTLGCDKDILKPKSITLATLKGNVVESVNQTTLSGVTVSISNYTESVQTDSMGQYTLQVELETSTSSEQITLTTWKSGYIPLQIRDLTIKANKTALVPTISMTHVPVEQENYIAGVSGNVVDEYENPLKEVLITISGHADHSYTDSSGSFNFEIEIDNTSENVTVNASKVGYNPCSVENVTLEANKTALIPTISMDCNSYIARISGSVIDKNANPLEGAQITISNHVESGFTNSLGAFSFSVEISSYTENVTLTAQKVGYGSSQVSNLTLKANETVIVPTISLIPEIFTAYIEGSVIDNVSGDSLEGVQITISNHIESGFTDNTGAFSFPVEIGSSTENVTLTAQKVGYGSSQVSSLTLKANETVIVPTISLIPEIFTAYVEGAVIDNISGNPLEGVQVTISNHVESGFTDNTGAFSFPVEIGSSTENVTLTAQKVGYGSSQVSSLTLKANETVTVPTISLVPEVFTTTIQGQVIDSLGNNPLEGALISVPDHYETGITDSSGNYNFSLELSSSTENVTVNVRKAFYTYADPGVASGGGVQVTLKHGQTTTVPTFVLKKCIAKIEGAVIDTLGAPIQDVLISVSNHALTSFTDNNGEFSFSVEISSTIENVTVSAIKPFYEDAQYSVTLEYDQTTVVPTFVLKLLP